MPLGLVQLSQQLHTTYTIFVLYMLENGRVQSRLKSPKYKSNHNKSIFLQDQSSWRLGEDVLKASECYNTCHQQVKTYSSSHESHYVTISIYFTPLETFNFVPIYLTNTYVHLLSHTGCLITLTRDAGPETRRRPRLLGRAWVLHRRSTDH